MVGENPTTHNMSHFYFVLETPNLLEGGQPWLLCKQTKQDGPCPRVVTSSLSDRVAFVVRRGACERVSNGVGLALPIRAESLLIGTIARCRDRSHRPADCPAQSARCCSAWEKMEVAVTLAVRAFPVLLFLKDR